MGVIEDAMNIIAARKDAAFGDVQNEEGDARVTLDQARLLGIGTAIDWDEVDELLPLLPHALVQVAGRMRLDAIGLAQMSWIEGLLTGAILEQRNGD